MSTGSLEVLKSGTIKFTCPTSFNDPFDCMPFYEEEAINNIANTRPDLIKAAAIRKGLSPGQRIQNKKKLVASLRNEIKKGNFSQNFLSGIGVVSLSRDPINILMWSHYADFHRGFVCEFRIPTQGYKSDLCVMKKRLFPIPVIYSDKRPNFRFGVENFNDILDKGVLTKSSVWEYEQEERVIDNDRGPGIHQYKRDEILTSVIAGMKISDKDYSSLSEIVQSLRQTSIENLELYRAEEVPQEYRLRVNNHPRI
jgi:DUF2971 family protein